MGSGMRFQANHPLARGIPTAHAAPTLAAQITSDDLPPIWLEPEGTAKGYALEPLYRSVPMAAKSDPKLYELPALVETLRVGHARERKMAEEELNERLENANDA